MSDLLVVTYRSTHHYLVSCRGSKLLVDAGWAGTLPQLRHELRRHGVEPAEIKYVMLTHHHPDHAGLTQEVKRAFGARLLIHERQIPCLDDLLAFHQRKGDAYEPVVVGEDDVVVPTGAGRRALASIGVAGELVETPGHSVDSVSLVLDGGIALVGDLRPPDQVEAESLEEVRQSWQRLQSLGVQTAYPSHGGPIEMADVERTL